MCNTQQGGSYTTVAADFQITGSIVPAYDVRAFTGEMLFDRSVSYTPFTQSGPLTFSSSGSAEGAQHLVSIDVTDTANVTWGEEFLG